MYIYIYMIYNICNIYIYISFTICYLILPYITIYYHILPYITIDSNGNINYGNI